MDSIPPLGDSKAGAAVVSAVYFALAVGCFIQFKLTNFRLYAIGGTLAAAMRGVSYAIRASTIADGASTIGKSVTSIFFQGAGFGIAIAIQLLIIAGWLRNTRTQFKPSLWTPLRIVLLAMFPCIIVFGPILGLASGLEIFDTATEHSILVGIRIRKSAALGMLIITCVSLLVAVFSSWRSLQATGWGFNLRKHACNTLLLILPGAFFLVWAASFRVASTFTHPEINNEEQLFYPLEVLPELLQLSMWCIPTLHARIHLSNRFQQWWKEEHSDDTQPIFGFSEPVSGSSTQLSESTGVSSQAESVTQKADVLATAV